MYLSAASRCLLIIKACGSHLSYDMTAHTCDLSSYCQDVIIYPESEWLRSLHKRMWSYKMWSYLVMIHRCEWDHRVWPWEYMVHFVMYTCEQTLRSLRWSKLVFPSCFFYLPLHYSAFAFCPARFCKICIFKQSSI